MISIEPATLAHAPALQTLFEDRDVTEHLAFPEPYPPGEMARYITTAIAGRQAGTRYVFAVIEPDGQPSGIALLKDVDARAGTGELGYAFGRAYWGGGRATAAADATAAFAFETLKLKTLRAVCGAMNLASLRVLAKLGFVEESRFDEVRTKWPEPRQQIVLRASRDAWKISRLIREELAIVPYDPRWPAQFAAEAAHLIAILPADLLGRIEHFGSTAVPGLAAKPIVDMLIEVRDLGEAQARIVPLLEAEGYDYVWRPTHGDDGPPFYAWFIRRDPISRVRTHHLHMVEAHFEHWRSLQFRDHLIAHPDVAAEYVELKRRLAAEFPRDRVAYTRGKKAFIDRITEKGTGSLFT